MNLLIKVYKEAKILKRFTITQISKKLYNHLDRNLIKHLEVLVKLKILNKNERTSHRIYYDFIQK